MISVPPIRCSLITLVTTVLLSADIASGHSVFIVVERQIDAPDRIQVIFEHAPYPGKGGYYEPLLERGKTWSEEKSGDESPIELSAGERLGKELLLGEADASVPRILVHDCEWGIYRGRMNYFSGKFIDTTKNEELEPFSATPELLLDIVPKYDGDSLELSVRFKGEPVPGARMWIWSPGGKSSEKKTDAEGIVRWEKAEPGTYYFATVHFLRDPEGEYQGESYKGLNYGTTCGFRLHAE